MRNTIFNVMLAALWVVSIFCILTGDAEVGLACGMFGIITTEPKRFDYRAFCVLGVNNDSRGGDSCGIFIDGKTEYAADKVNKFFYNFFQQSKVLNRLNKTQVAVGHCRKASVGAITEKQAQPIVFYNKEGVAEYVVLHNGTIHNYEALAKKYIPGVNIFGMTDSQVMANIIYRCGYDVLAEYMGGASFVFIDYRNNPKNPEIMFFKGESKQYSYSTTTTEERPMYVACDHERLIFSSIGTYLAPLMPYETTIDTEPNKLLVWKNGFLEVMKEYDRKDCFQSAYTYTTYPSNVYYADDYHYSKGTYYSTTEDARRVHVNPLGKYYINKKFLHGKVNISKWGYTSDYDTAYFMPFYFWNGVMLYNEKCFHFLETFVDSYGCAITELENNFPAMLFYLSPYPEIDYKIGSDSIRIFSKYDTPEVWENFSGTLSMFMSNARLYIKNGMLKKSVKSDNDEALEQLAFLQKSKVLDFGLILKMINEDEGF